MIGVYTALNLRGLPSFLTLLLVLVVLGLLTATLASLLMAQSLLRPPRMTAGKALYLLNRLAPDDLGLPYEQSTFVVRDERTGKPLPIVAWWIPCESAPGAPETGRCAVLIHGYADAKVGAIAWAPLWHALGYHLLVPDLRAHGESGGRFTTAGFFERHDLAQVLNQVRAARPESTREIVLFGASMGAAVAAATAASMEPGDISAVVLESPFLSFRAAACAHMDRLGLPGGLIRSCALWLAQRISGADYAEVQLPDLLSKLTCPVMAISPSEDAYLLPGDAEKIRAAFDQRAATPGAAQFDSLWQTTTADHLTAYVNNPEEYRRRVIRFLAAARDGGVSQDSAQAPRGR